MSTRSYIGFVADNRHFLITYAYCHFDGSPSHQLPILEGCYNTPEKVEQLIMRGSMSFLCEEIEDIKYYDQPPLVVGGVEPGMSRNQIVERFKEVAGDVSYAYLFYNNEWILC